MLRGRSQVALIALAFLLLVSAIAAAQPQRASYTTEVPAGQYRAVRLHKIPQGAFLAIVIKLVGRIPVAVVYGNPSPAAPGATKPLFSGLAEGRLSFSVTAPVPADYYVVLDNRRGTEAKTVEVTITAARKPPGPKRPGESDT